MTSGLYTEVISKILMSNIEDYSNLGCSIDFANLGMSSAIAGECFDHPNDNEYRYVWASRPGSSKTVRKALFDPL